jgi:head-to-tail connecting protein
MGAAVLKLTAARRKAGRNFDQEAAEVTEITQRFAQLMNIQRIYAVEWQEIADYVMPRKNSIIVQRIPGSKRTQRLFDSTALEARDKMASAIQGGLTSSYVRWLFLQTDDEELNDDQQTAIWLDRVATLMLGDFNRSNFPGESGELYNDAVTFASAAMFFEEIPTRRPGQFEGFRFRTLQPGRYAWSEGPDGKVDTLFSELLMSRAAIKRKWPDVAEEALQLAGKEKDQLLSVIHAVMPADETGDAGWKSIYVLTQGLWKLAEGAFDEFPFMCLRWSKASGETYGRGPTHEALPDIRSLNKLREMELRALPKIIDPPLTVVGGDMLGPARLTPGGVTTLRTSRENIGPLLAGMDLRQSGMAAQDLIGRIQGIYHLSDIQLREGPQMTATEVSARREQMLMLLGPVLYGRMQFEFLDPVVKRAFNIRRRANALPPLPPAMRLALQKKKIQLRVHYDGPVARSQRAGDIDSVNRLNQIVTAIAPLAQDALDTIDFDEMIRVSGRKLGVPPSILRDRQATDQVRAVKQKQAADQAQAQQAAAAAQAAGQAAPALKVLGKAPEPGSPLAQPANQGPANG